MGKYGENIGKKMKKNIGKWGSPGKNPWENETLNHQTREHDDNLSN